MRIVYIHQHFATNEGSSGTRSYDVSKYMVQDGHDIFMISGTSERSGIKPLPWYRLFKKEVIDGINITICNTPYSNSLGKVARFASFFWFAFLSTIAAIFVKKPDLIFATSTPLTVGIPGYIAAVIKQVPFVFEVRDIWPESFIRSGWVTGKELHIKMMSWLEEFCYRKAVKILLVSKGFEERLIERGLDPAKLKTILLGADGHLFNNVKPDEEFLDKYNLHEKKIAIYTGAHGKANGLDYILDAADLSREHSDIVYVLIGDGSEKPHLQRRLNNEKISNVVLANSVKKDHLPRILAVCQFGLMILKDIHEPRPVTPNKIFDYMFMSMPSLINFEGPTWDIIKEIKAGLLVDAKKPHELADAVIKLADNPKLCKEMGQRAFKAAQVRFDRKIIAYQLIEEFQEVVSSYRKKN